MPKCQRCGKPLTNRKEGNRLVICDDPFIQCIYCFSTHNWHDGKLNRGGEKK